MVGLLVCALHHEQVQLKASTELQHGPSPRRSEGICSFAHDEDTVEDKVYGQW